MSDSRNGFSGYSDILDKLWREPVERYTLENGLTVILKEDYGSGLASTQIWVKTGSIHEEPLLGSGLSHFLEHMLFKGTEKRSGHEFTQAIQETGGYVNAYTSLDRTVYYINGSSEYITLSLDLLGDAVFNSILPDDEFDSERDVILREIDMGLDDPDRLVSRLLFENAYLKHPYQYPVIGHEELFKKVSHENLKEYYYRRYIPANTVMVVTGDFCSNDIKPEIEKLFSSYSKDKFDEPLIFPEPKQSSVRENNSFKEVNLSRGCLGIKIPSFKHVDSPALDLLSLIMGHGNSSVLNQNLREKKRIVHHIDTSVWNPSDEGLFLVTYLCEEHNRENVQSAIMDEIAQIKEQGISMHQLEKAMRQLIVNEVNVRKTVSGQASRLGYAEVVVGDINYLKNYFSKLLHVTTDIIQEISSKYLIKDHMTSVSLNPTNGSN